MKILAINSSPRKDGESKTELMLDHLVQGMRDAGAKVEVVTLREKKINNCIGCFTCWTRTPGRCIQKDDMSMELFPKWLASDLVVYASPLYYHTMNSAMSAFKERTLPAVSPLFEVGDDGNVFHPFRNKIPAAVYLSVCGFPQDAEFDAFSEFLHHTRHKDMQVVAEIYRSAAETMTRPFFKEKLDDILAATKQAGREIVGNMVVNPATMARIKQPIVESDQFAQMGNLFWKSCIAEGVTPKTFSEKNMVPRPDSLESFMLLLQLALSPRAVEGRKITLQFDFFGEVNASCYFTIETGHVEAHKGAAETADLVLETPFGLWMDIMTRKADGRQMFMEQKYKVSGDLELMVKLFAPQEDAQ